MSLKVLENQLLTEEEKKLLGILQNASLGLAKQILTHLEKEAALRIKKEKKRQEFAKTKKRKYSRKPTKTRPKIRYAPYTLPQAIIKGIPLREPHRKHKINREETRPYLFEVENEFGSPELTQISAAKKSPVEELPLKELIFVPEKVYLQRLDTDNSKILVKMFVDWGYLDEDRMPLFYDPKRGEIAECKIHLVDINNHSIARFSLKHCSNFFIDTEYCAYPLFVGQITGLEPNSKYRYRIECYRKDDGKLFAGTPLRTFRASFNLSEKNKPLFFSACSDLHGGRNGGFMRGKIKRKVISGNEDLERVYASIATNEQAVTFGEGYSLAFATGDLTENGSYSEYWSDLFKRCSSLWNHVPLVAAIGNHDYYCGGTGRGNILGGFEEDCRFWHRYITNPFVGKDSLPGHWFSFDQGNAHLVFLDSVGTRWGKYELDCGSEQWRWLENDLREWRQKVNNGEKVPQFCFVFHHLAIMSIGFWGRGMNWGTDERAQSYLTPLFRKYGVDMVFFGHDHIYQRSKWMGTNYLISGRSGGITRPYCWWVKKRTIYDIERISEETKTRIYTTMYVPPNLNHLSKKEQEEFESFKQMVRKELLSQPTTSFYFFGVRKINQKIGALMDKDAQLKEKLIDEMILPKLDDHTWFRAYAVEKSATPREREIVDMFFFKARGATEFDGDSYDFRCPEKVVE